LLLCVRDSRRIFEHQKKKKTSLFGGKIDMNFFLKKKTRIWDLFCFSLVFYLWWVGVVAFF
jgi:hypothetical protein